VKPPPSLPQLRTDLKAALSAERDAQRRKEIGRALAAIERAESKGIDRTARKC
jgi:hypothetical protein